MQSSDIVWSSGDSGGKLDLGGYEITFNEDFNSLSLNTGAKGGTWFSGLHAPIGLTSFAKPGASFDPFSVSDGALNIQAKYVDGKWQSGLLQTYDESTKTGFAQTFGYFEMRASFTGGDGAWPAFWLISPSGNGQARTEIDVIEAYGSDPNGFYTTLHYTPATNTKDITAHLVSGERETLPKSMFDGEYHTYGTMVTPEWIITYFDGKEIARTAASKYTQAPFYMIVDMAISGGSGASPTADYGMSVDYIRAYSNPAIAAQAYKGTAGNDFINGSTGGDLLDGGLGADTMTGGRGNDTYMVDNAGDKVVEGHDLGLGGVDTVQTTVSYTLSDNIEHLILLGKAPINGTGNSKDNVITGNDGDNVIDGGRGADQMAGGDGDDSYIVDNIGDTVIELAGGGTDTVRANVNYTLADNVENIVLTGANAINATGNALDNMLTGNDAANVLNGGAGADTMIGGGGNDTYLVDNVGDMVKEVAGEGTDTVKTSIDYKLTANVENLILAGKVVRGTGNDLANAITGNYANNIIDGGAGADTMTGGRGDDVYIVDNARDSVVEWFDFGLGGVDTVRSSVSYALSDNIENLTLIGSERIDAKGNGVDNVIIGNIADNVIDGGGGADRMIGDRGDDTYIVDNADDVVIEKWGEGHDTVLASVSYALSNNVNNITLTGRAAINATGNGLNNALIGNDAANVLDGGAGGDTMSGGSGNDTYIVDNSRDVVKEVAGAGIDTVKASISYVLGANVENLTLTGTDAIDGTGNDLANLITGNAGDNLLDGGAGADVMTGGRGDDTYIVDNAGDTIVEWFDGGLSGNDTVRSAISYTLGNNLDNLTLTGTRAINATGNTLDNVIKGNAGDNVIDGGYGKDVLTGGGGNDTFVFRAGQSNGDRITDFDGRGNGVGDVIKLAGYGLGAKFNIVDNGIEVRYAGHVDFIELNTKALHSSDIYFT